MNVSRIHLPCSAALLASLLFSPPPARSRADAHYPEPENGAFSGGAYANRYFDLRYPIPAGWREDAQGPPPSVSAYYSLAAFISTNENNSGTLLIAAQDDFFSLEPSANALDFVRRMRAHLDPSLSVPEAPDAVQFSGRTFAHLNYNGAGLHHEIFAIEVRCHTLIFSFTSANSQSLEAAAASLNGLAFGSARAPVCIRDYADAGTILHRVTPEMTGPRFAGIPVRIVIGPSGDVEHIHPVAGFPEQMQSVAAALSQWKFKPYLLGGKAVVVETGLIFHFQQGPQ